MERATASTQREMVTGSGIRPARGIAIAFALGGLAWGGILVLALWLRELV